MLYIEVRLDNVSVMSSSVPKLNASSDFSVEDMEPEQLEPGDTEPLVSVDHVGKIFLDFLFTSILLQ